MTPDLRTYIACERAESGISEGFDVRYAVESAAHSMAVDVAEVAQLVLDKLVECSRARESLRAMASADEEIDSAPEAKRAILRHAHVVRKHRAA